MSLDSSTYFAFLVIVVLARYLVAQRYANWLLMCASTGFYVFADIGSLGIIVLLIAINYLFAANLHQQPDGRLRNILFWSAIFVNASVLASFKVLVASDTVAVPLLPRTESIDIYFPLGLSFLAFQLIAFVTDIYRRDYNWDKPRFRDFFLFSMFFPQITSGPIPRGHKLMPQLRSLSKPDISSLKIGFSLILLGLVKKYVVANRLSAYVEQGFSIDLPHSTIPTAIAICFNAAEIYADFSGYTDIAIGSAILLGIKLAANFDRPFGSYSVTEFWRRWHISLSSWLRDYVFMPLFIFLRNLRTIGAIIAFLITFMLCGLWHSLAGPMLLFGFLHGTAMSTELFFRSRVMTWEEKLPTILFNGLARSYTFLFLMLTIALFRAEDFGHMMMILQDLFSMTSPINSSELFAYRGPFEFALCILAVLLFKLSGYLYTNISRLGFPKVCLFYSIVLLLLGLEKDGEFIYAQF